MRINNFNSNGAKFNLIYDGNMYVIQNNFYGVIAYSKNIERDLKNDGVQIDLIICNELPCDYSAITRAITKQETMYCKRDVFFTAEYETPIYDENGNFHGGIISIQKMYLTLKVNER